MTRGIGSFVMAIFLIAIPILVTLSFELNWYLFAKYIFTVGTLVEVIVLTIVIYKNAE